MNVGLEGVCVCVYIYIYICVCVCVCIYIYIYMQTILSLKQSNFVSFGVTG